ncbi:MAG: dihydrodipicolinate synthase family protein [Candidatus Latescibacterota bacterium]
MIRIEDSVITAQTLEGRLSGEKQVEICSRAKLTPSAQDFLRDQGVEVVRREAGGEVPRSPVVRQADPVAVPGGRKAFAGIFCPNIVIFDGQGKINYPEMERYVNWLIESGIQGLYPNGSTGEFVRLSWEERQDVVRLISEVNQGRVPVLAGASEANLRDVLKMAEFYASIGGVDAISLVPPYYYKISDESLFEYFAEIAEESPLDILLYNIPQFTQEISLELMERLLPYERIFGTKDSSRDQPRLINTMHRLRAVRPDYVVLVGCEEILLPSVMMGASGGTIATSGIIPEVIVELYEKARSGDIERARALQYRILDLINLMLLGINFPEGFKTGVAARGFDVGPARASTSAAEQEYLLKLESQINCVLADMGYDVRGPRACPVTNLPPIVGR